MNRMSPKVSRTSLIVLVVALASAWSVLGCARKATETPPVSAQPPGTEPPATTPTPSETPTPDRPSSDISADEFQPAFFDYDSATLRDDARAALDHNARVLRDKADARITVEGHCDERGTVEYNQALGERRAQAAMEYLVAAGISASRIEVVSYGKERPFDSGHDERAWALNRRAHITVR